MLQKRPASSANKIEHRRTTSLNGPLGAFPLYGDRNIFGTIVDRHVAADGADMV